MSDDLSDSDRPGAQRRRSFGLLVSAGVALLLVAAAVLLGLQVRSDVAAQTARTQAADAAEQQAVTVTSVSSSNAEAGVADVLDGATGTFRTAYQQQAAALEQSVRDQQVTATSRVIDSGVVVSRVQSAVVLVVVEATVSNRAQPTGSARRYRMQLGLQRVDGRWLTSSLEVLG